MRRLRNAQAIAGRAVDYVIGEHEVDHLIHQATGTYTATSEAFSRMVQVARASAPVPKGEHRLPVSRVLWESDLSVRMCQRERGCSDRELT